MYRLSLNLLFIDEYLLKNNDIKGIHYSYIIEILQQYFFKSLFYTINLFLQIEFYAPCSMDGPYFHIQNKYSMKKIEYHTVTQG